MNKQGRLTSKFRVANLATIQHYLRKISTRAFFSCVAYVFYSNLFEISTYIGTQPNCGRQSLVMCCCIFTVKVPFYRLSLTDESYTLAKKRKKHFANCTDKGNNAATNIREGDGVSSHVLILVGRHKAQSTIYCCVQQASKKPLWISRP